MERETLQAWWARKQGLDGSLAGAGAAEVLERTGWARSVGSVGPYLTLFSRAGVARKTVDAAVADLQIQELPAVRGCTYVVPSPEFALALRAGEAFGSGSELKLAEKLGVSAKEIDRLCRKVLDSLAAGPLDPGELRDAIGGAARSLGEEGKKKGIGTTLPLALGKLQQAGELRRLPATGRLDQQRYRYALWRPNPLAKFRMSREEVRVEVARRYFRWIGPASLAEFQGFSGLGVKAAKEATAPLKLWPLAHDGTRFLLADDIEAFRAFRVPRKPRYALVSSLDGIALLRRDLKGLLDPDDAARKVLGDGALEPIGGLSDLPSHAILDRGRLVGLWEYDVETSSIVWRSFGAAGKELTAAVASTEAFVRDQLGDARSFSLDSPKSRVPRIEALRRAARK